MAWTTYIFDVSDLRLIFARTEQTHYLDLPLTDDYIRESVYEYLVSEALDQVMQKRSGQFKPVYLRSNKTWKDIGRLYYDFVGYEFETRIMDILNSRHIHHMPGELIKTLVAGDTLFLTRKNYHLR